MIKFLTVIIIVILFTGCIESDLDVLNQKALFFYNQDKKIDKKESEILCKLINDSDDESIIKFKKSGLVDFDKYRKYLFKYFKSKNIVVLESAIWDQNNSSNKEKFNVNVFIENSSSMDGYVKGVTNFETAIYNLLGDFKISQVCDKLNLNYINKSVYVQNKDALPSDIEDFIEKLEPANFKARGGDRSVSDLKNIFNTVLKSVNKDNVSILISDFVFSPGKNNNAQDYLNNQSVGIKIDFAEKLNRYDLNTIILKLESGFDGIYYDKTNKPIKYNGKRPYYVWIFGNTNQLEKINQQKILQKIKGGYLNKLVFQPTKNTRQIDYKILIRPRIGEFSSEGIIKKQILEAESKNIGQNKQVFEFNLAVDFHNEFQDQSYYLDKENYLVSNQQYEVFPEINNIKNQSLSSYSHVLRLKTNQLISEGLKIDVLGRIPKWVQKSSSNDDSEIAYNKMEQNKTFGFKYLIEGVSDAYYSKTNVINSMKIIIKK